MKDHDLRHLTRRLKSLQHDTLQPEMGQHMEYAGNVTQKSNNRIMLLLHANLARGKLYGYSFCEKPIFPYCKEIYFYLTTKFVENIKNGKPHLNPN